MLKLVLATNNKGKVVEIKQKLKNFPFIIESLQDYPQIPEIEENGNTFLENSIIKATTVTSFTGLPALADDSGLEIDYLNGSPGIFSSRWGKNDDERISRVLKELEGIPEEQRQARFICVMSLATPKNKIYSSEGVCEGKIGFQPRGHAGFGYDPIFIPDGYNHTFAEIGEEEKNRISHRAKALNDIIPKIVTYFQLK